MGKLAREIFSTNLVNMLLTFLQGFASNVTFNDINRTEPASLMCDRCKLIANWLTQEINKLVAEWLVAERHACDSIIVAFADIKIRFNDCCWPRISWMSEHPRSKFAPHLSRSQIFTSMPPLVLFIISEISVDSRMRITNKTVVLHGRWLCTSLCSHLPGCK
jgi:hypothetical protein